MLGHAFAAMTLDVYSGLFDDDLGALAERMDAAHQASVLITLMAAAALALALVQLGEVESARVLGEDTLQRGRRVLGSDHPITLYLVQVAGIGHLVLGDDAVGDRHSRPL
jgi:hypothetical protein